MKNSKCPNCIYGKYIRNDIYNCNQYKILTISRMNCEKFKVNNWINSLNKTLKEIKSFNILEKSLKN